MEPTGGGPPAAGRAIAQRHSAYGGGTGGSGPRTPPPSRAALAPVSFRVERADRHRPLLIVALTGVGIGVLLAVFGLPPVNFGDPLQLVGIVCPFCGGTRALQHLFLGDLGLSWRYNPLSMLLVAGAVATLVRYAVGVVSGRWLTVRVRRNAVTVIVPALALGVLWLNQLLHTELLLP